MRLKMVCSRISRSQGRPRLIPSVRDPMPSFFAKGCAILDYYPSEIGATFLTSKRRNAIERLRQRNPSALYICSSPAGFVHRTDRDTLSGEGNGGSGGIRTHGAFRLGGFQDRSLSPLGHTSLSEGKNLPTRNHLAEQEELRRPR